MSTDAAETASTKYLPPTVQPATGSPSVAETPGDSTPTPAVSP